MDPYVPEPLLLAEYWRDAEASASVAATVPVAVDVLASSVTAPVWSAPALGASLAPVIVMTMSMVS